MNMVLRDTNGFVDCFTSKKSVGSNLVSIETGTASTKFVTESLDNIDAVRFRIGMALLPQARALKVV